MENNTNRDYDREGRNPQQAQTKRDESETRNASERQSENNPGWDRNTATDSDSFSADSRNRDDRNSNERDTSGEDETVDGRHLSRKEGDYHDVQDSDDQAGIRTPGL